MMKKNIAIAIFFVLLQKLSVGQMGQLLIPYRNGNLWGFCDTVGNIKIPLQYDSACFFKTSKKQQSAMVYKNKYAGIIDNNGNILVPFRYDYITTDIMETEIQCFITENNFKRGLYINGKEVLPTVYNKIWPERGDCFVVTGNKKRGLFNTNGKQVIPVAYNSISFLKMENKYVYYKAVNDSGTVIYTDTLLHQPLQEEDDKVFTKVTPINQLELDSLKKKYQFDKMDYLSDGVMTVEKAGLKGFWIGRIKKLVLPAYTDIKFAIRVWPCCGNKYASEYLVAVKKGEKYAIVNENGTIVYPFEYDGMINRYDNIIILKMGDKMGATILNKPCKDIPVKYDALERVFYEPDSGNAFVVFVVKINNRTGYVGQNGIEYFKD
jgi:WG containing repeat